MRRPLKGLSAQGLSLWPPEWGSHSSSTQARAPAGLLSTRAQSHPSWPPAAENGCGGVVLMAEERASGIDFDGFSSLSISSLCLHHQASRTAALRAHRPLIPMGPGAKIRLVLSPVAPKFTPNARLTLPRTALDLPQVAFAGLASTRLKRRTTRLGAARGLRILDMPPTEPLRGIGVARRPGLGREIKQQQLSFEKASLTHI